MCHLPTKFNLSQLYIETSGSLVFCHCKLLFEFHNHRKSSIYDICSANLFGLMFSFSFILLGIFVATLCYRVFVCVVYPFVTFLFNYGQPPYLHPYICHQVLCVAFQFCFRSQLPFLFYRVVVTRFFHMSHHYAQYRSRDLKLNCDNIDNTNYVFSLIERP